MALRTRSDYFGNVETTVRSEELARTSRLVARLTGYPVQYNKAIIGRNAFAHEAGIHQHGVLEDRETYEIIDASTVGQEAAQIVLGKHSGRHAFADSLDKMGLHVQGDALNQAFVRFKELADRKVQITEADLEAIVAEELGLGRRAPVHDREPRAPRRHASPRRARPSCSATGPRRSKAKASGNGMIDAAIDAISTGHRRVGHGARLQGVVGDGWWRRARRRRDPARVRRAEGVGPRRLHRRGRGLGARLPQCGQQDRASARASRPARGRRGRDPDRTDLWASSARRPGSPTSGRARLRACRASPASARCSRRSQLPRRLDARICELGTGAGVGLAWIVYGLGERDDATVYTVDTNQEMLATVATAGWPGYVEFVCDDGANAVQEFAPFDLVFADAPGGKIEGLDATIAALAPGGVLVVDDMDPALHADDGLSGAARGGTRAAPGRSVARRGRARLRQRCDRGDEARRLSADGA